MKSFFLIICLLFITFITYAQVTYRDGVSSNNGGGGTSIIVTMPANVNGDVLLMAIAIRGGTGTTITTPAGWIQLGSPFNSTTVLQQCIYWRVASNEPSSYSVTISNQKASATVMALSGASATLPTSTFYGGQVNASGVTWQTPTLSFAASTGLSILFASEASDGVPNGGTTNYNQFGLLNNRTSGAGASSRTAIYGLYKTTNSASVTSITSQIGNFTNSAVSIGHSIFIKVPSVSTNKGKFFLILNQ
jgi:hypothetical protein